MWTETKADAAGDVACASTSAVELTTSPQHPVLRHRLGTVTALCAKLLATLLIAGAGYGVALLAGLHGVNSSSGYFLLATVLLAIGLFSSTYDIDIAELKRNVRLVLVAVTFGVLAKAALIAGVMYFIFGKGNPAYLVLGVAMAQIDPLSVAVTRRSSQLSPRAKAILSAWSSLDDPVTAILTIYLSSLALSMQTARPGGPLGDNSVAAGFSGFGTDLLGNGALVLGAAVVWLLLLQVTRRVRHGSAGDADRSSTDRSSTGLRITGTLSLVAIAAIAVDNFWLLGLAVIGLFFRPGIGKVLSYASFCACFVATFLLGIVLADDVNLIPGIVLGAATFGSQVVVGALVTWRLPRPDSLRLALGQQSGITAVILALLLETVFPGTVAIVAPAILVINALHLISNAMLDRREKRARQGQALDVTEGRSSAPPDESPPRDTQTDASHR